VHAILHRNLLPRCPAAYLFGMKERGWLATQPLPPDEQATVESLLRELDHTWTELTVLESELALALRYAWPHKPQRNLRPAIESRSFPSD
jgi:hypothetical protein